MGKYICWMCEWNLGGLIPNCMELMQLCPQGPHSPETKESGQFFLTVSREPEAGITQAKNSWLVTTYSKYASPTKRGGTLCLYASYGKMFISPLYAKTSPNSQGLIATLLLSTLVHIDPSKWWLIPEPWIPSVYSPKSSCKGFPKQTCLII